jgi:hypothetical protein
MGKSSAISNYPETCEPKWQTDSDPTQSGESNYALLHLLTAECLDSGEATGFWCKEARLPVWVAWRGVAGGRPSGLLLVGAVRWHRRGLAPGAAVDNFCAAASPSASSPSAASSQPAA